MRSKVLLLVTVFALCISEVYPTFKISSRLGVIDSVTAPFRTGLKEYLKCGSITQKFQKLLNTMQLAHAFDHYIKNRIDSTLVCTACKILLDVVIKERRKGLSRDQINSLVIDLCIALNVQTPAVCEGVVRLNINILLYIIDNRPEIRADRICAIVAQSYGCTGNITEWSVDIPQPNSSRAFNRVQASSSRPLKILHLTDVHYDRFYLPGSNANCQEPLCCQVDSGKPVNRPDAAGFWGDYRDCDIPLNVVVDTLNQITHCHDDVDYVYFSGDIISHRIWDTSTPSNTENIYLIQKMILDAFPDVPVFFVLGNHEPHPVNVFSPSEITEDGLSTQWLFDVVSDIWSVKLGEEITSTVRRGGFYTVLVKPGFRVIALNSNVAYTFNWWLLYDDVDPYEQLQWLSDTLHEAERNDELVHVISHLPSTDSQCYRIWSREYRRIINRFSSTITAAFNGHSHYSEMSLYHSIESPSIPISIAWNGGSLTTFSNNNPNYRIYTVDPGNYFVAHSNVQQLLASIWYEGLPGFRRKNMVLQVLEIVRIGILFPFFSIAYIIAPHSIIGQTMRKPFIKFICHSASYFTFLFMLILASQRIETLFFAEDPIDRIPTKRGEKPSLVEWIILAWVSGLIWSEIKQLWDVGLEEYVRDMWNVIDFITNSLYVATVALRVVSYYQVQKNGNETVDSNERKNWDAWDPMLISEGLFSAANIFSSLKLVYIFSVNPHLGPLQVSLSRMVMDIMKFFFLYVLVLFAFSCGLNQLLWYYAEAERQNCPTESTSPNVTTTDTNACQIWRRFANLFETSQTLFWAVFGLIDLESFDLSGIKIFTRFWGMLMFGTYSVINIVVLLNLLIAMMNHSYQLISERADVEWKFARSKLWISYFEEGGTVPPPFNIVPTSKSLWYVFQWVQRKFCGHSRAAKKEHMRTIRRKVKQASERDFRYQSIMRNLVRRYVTVEQRKAENQGVTEDDVNEIKQDISAFRFELIEILKNSGMNTSTAHSGMGSGTGGKKNRQKERRLMKGFNIGPQPSTTTGPLPPVAEFIASLQHHHDGHHDLFGSTLSGSINEGHHHRGLGRFHLKRTPSHKRRWGTLIEAAKTGKVSRLIGRSRSEDSVCNSHCRENSHNHIHSHSNSPASEDNATESPSDSNPSLDISVTASHSEVHHHGLAGGLALLRKKRKKFSASRNTSPVVVPPNPVEHAIAVCIGKSNKKVSQVLKRASSVPTRVPEVVQIMQRHDQIQSQQDSVEIPLAQPPPTLTPSTTEESVTNAGHANFSSGVSSREPLLYNSSSSNQATGSSQTPEDDYRNNGHNGGLNKLPGVVPLGGHSGPSGWL